MNLTYYDVKGGGLTNAEIDANMRTSLAVAGGLAIFPITRYGAVAGSDVTAALQAALNACVAAGGGTVLLDTTTESFLDGALLSGANGMNCQVKIPLIAKGDQCVVKIKGISAPNLSTEGVSALARNSHGSILTSRNTSGGFVFGTESEDTGVTGIRNYVCVVFEDFELRTQPGGSGVDFTRLIQFQFRGTFKTTIVTPLYNTSKPVGTRGIIMPDLNNKLHLEAVGTVMAEGYERGLTIGEHTCLFHYAVLGCVYGLVVPSGYNSHSTNIFQYSCETSNNSILLEGIHDLNIFGYDCEHLSGSGKWYDFVADVVQTGGSSRVFISNSTVVKSYVGPVNEFVIVGGANVRVLVGAGANMLADDKNITVQKVSGLTASRNPSAATTINVSWSAQSSLYDGYQILYRIAGGNYPATPQVTINSGAVASYQITGTDNTARYELSIRGMRGGVVSDYSDGIFVEPGQTAAGTIIPATDSRWAFSPNSHDDTAGNWRPFNNGLNGATTYYMDPNQSGVATIVINGDILDVYAGGFATRAVNFDVRVDGVKKGQVGVPMGVAPSAVRLALRGLGAGNHTVEFVAIAANIAYAVVDAIGIA